MLSFLLFYLFALLQWSAPTGLLRDILFRMADDVRLLQTQMNDVFLMVTQKGLSVSGFQWDVEQLEERYPGGASYCKASVLNHVPSRFFYKFGQFSDICSPGGQSRVRTIELLESQHRWEQRYPHIWDWLSVLKEQIDTPDLWSELVKDQGLYLATTARLKPGDVFTSQEKKFLAQRLSEINRRLATLHQLTDKQTKDMDRGFSEIIEGMDRFGKKDWFAWAIGTLTTVALNSLFAPAIARDLFHGFIGVVGPLFNTALKLMP